MTKSIPKPSLRREEATLFDMDVGRFRYSYWRNVSIGVWAGQATFDAMRRIAGVSQKLEKEYPRGHSNIAFVLDGAPAPTPEAQAILARVFDPKNSDLSCMAILVEGSGFWASHIRSVITSAHLAASASLKLRVHETIDQLLAWFPEEHLRRTGEELRPEALRQVLRAARQLGATGTEAERVRVPRTLGTQ